jgi:hypothetical protein
MFYYLDLTNPMTDEVQRHIMQRLDGGGVRSFPLTDDNPNTATYLAWVAEGNEATEWNPEETE